MRPEHEAFTEQVEAGLFARYGAACFAFTTAEPERRATLFAFRHPPGSPDGVYLVAHRDLLDAATGRLAIPPGATSPAPPELTGRPGGAAAEMLLAEPARHFATATGRVAIAPLARGGFSEHGLAHGYLWTPPAPDASRRDGVLPWDRGPAFLLGYPAGRPRGARSSFRSWAATAGDGTVRLHAPPPDGYAGGPVFALLMLDEIRGTPALLGLAAPDGEVVPVEEIARAVEPLA